MVGKAEQMCIFSCLRGKEKVGEPFLEAGEEEKEKAEEGGV
jgi:hypothetical protein